MKSTVFTIVKTPVNSTHKQVFKISHYKPTACSPLERTNSAQETLEKAAGELAIDIPGLKLSGKRKKCEKEVGHNQLYPQAKETVKIINKGTGSKKSSLNTFGKMLKRSERSPEVAFYGQACEFLKWRVHSEINNEVQKSREEGSDTESVYLERLESIVKGMIDVGVEKDVMGRYLIMQSELIKNVSFLEFEKLMSGTKAN